MNSTIQAQLGKGHETPSRTLCALQRLPPQTGSLIVMAPCTLQRLISLANRRFHPSKLELDPTDVGFNVHDQAKMLRLT